MYDVVDSATPISKPHPSYPSEVRLFEDVEDFLDWLEKHPLPIGEADEKWGPTRSNYWHGELPSNAKYPSTLVGGKDKFNCTSSYTTALELLKDGWVAGRNRMLEFQGAVEKAFHRSVEMPHFVIAEEGQDVEMGRFMAGEPLDMLGYRTTDTDKQSPLITLDLNLACSTCETRCCDHTPVDPDWQLMRGAVLFLLVKIMRQAGLFPEVWLGTVAFYDAKNYSSEVMGGFKARGFEPYMSSGYGPNDYAHQPIKAKKRTTLVRALAPGDFFDPNRLAFLFAHDAFVRRLQFRMEEVLNFAEGGVFPMATTEIRHTQGTHLGKYAPTTVGALPLEGRDLPENTPDFAVLLEGREAQSHIHIPSYPTLAMTDKEALGAYGKPETAARYLLKLLTAAGVRLT